MSGKRNCYGLDNQGFDSWLEQEILLFCRMSRPVLVPTQCPAAMGAKGSFPSSKVAWV
jgi:hypothetical protein